MATIKFYTAEPIPLHLGMKRPFLIVNDRKNILALCQHFNCTKNSLPVLQLIFEYE
jgi:hypothetical protein